MVRWILGGSGGYSEEDSERKGMACIMTPMKEEPAGCVPLLWAWGEGRRELGEMSHLKEVTTTYQ